MSELEQIEQALTSYYRRYIAFRFMAVMHLEATAPQFIDDAADLCVAGLRGYQAEIRDLRLARDAAVLAREIWKRPT